MVEEGECSIVIYTGLISISHNLKSEFMWRLEIHMSIIIGSVNSSGHAKFFQKILLLLLKKQVVLLFEV